MAGDARPIAYEDFVPHWVRRILVADLDSGEIDINALSRQGRTIFGTTRHKSQPEEVASSVEFRSGAIESMSLNWASVPFDCVLLPDTAHYISGLEAVIRRLAQCLSPEGCVLITTPNGAYWNRGPDSPGLDSDKLRDLVVRSGLRVFEQWGNPGRPCPEGEEEPAGEVSIREHLTWVVLPDYNPLDHARRLRETGDAEASHDLLSRFPAKYLDDHDLAHALGIESLKSLLAWDEAEGPDPTLDRMWLSHRYFSGAVACKPFREEPYLLHARMCTRTGAHNLAARMVRTVQHLMPEAEIPSDLHEISHEGHITPTIEASLAGRSESRPKILFITVLQPDYGLDLLFDGLCHNLGPAHVVEYPWKPTLHGIYEGPIGYEDYYPCNFKHPGETRSLEELLAALRQREFDLVVWGDCYPQLAHKEAQAIAAAAPEIPWVLVDQRDECNDCRGGMREYLGRDCLLYFKRELLECANFGPDCHPLPFAYPLKRIPENVEGPRPRTLFWAGARYNGLRPTYIAHLEQIMGRTLGQTVSQKDYVKMLMRSQIGLSFGGGGYDTVRYWELPAHGCLLLSERPPIQIPGNFTDGESAVYFNDSKDLDEKLAFYAHHPHDSAAIAAAGHEHLKRYHTSVARATQFLHACARAIT